MKRRNIAIGGVSINSRLDEVAKVRELLTTKANDPDTVEKFANFIVNSGWSPADMESAMKQHGNRVRPAVQAFLFHHEHVLDQIRLQQGTYTRFKDTAADPNFALRMPAESELLLRRLTPGDLWQLRAAHVMQGKDPYRVIDAENDPTYWQLLWQTMLGIGGITTHRAALLQVDPATAFVTAYSFCDKYADYEVNEYYSLDQTFFSERSNFYLGTTAPQSERVRQGEDFMTVATIDDAPREVHFMAAVILTSYGIDAYARARLSEYSSLNTPTHTYEGLFHHYLTTTAPPNIRIRSSDENNQTNPPTATDSLGQA